MMAATARTAAGATEQSRVNFPDPPSRSAGLPEWADWCASIGRLTSAFKVFPCWPGEKLPLRKGWQQSASWDALTVKAMWQNDPRANIGLAIQPGFLAIDADLYKPGKEALLDAYEAKNGELPRTLEFRSARGGVHLVYKTGRSLGNSTGSLPDFGDVRGPGGLIIGPGSWFEGQRYGIDRVAAPVALPSAVDACLVERKHRAPEERRELPQFVSLDDPANPERFVTWLRREAAVSVEGQGGNNTLAATGAMASSYALSWEVALECLVEHWNPRCQPPWDDGDLERHGGSGYRSASSSFGNMAERDPKLMFPVSTAPEQTYEGWGSPVVRLDDLLARGDAPARQWALGSDTDGWMPLHDLTLLYGPGGAGKTTLVGQMARSFAAALPLFGSIPARAMPVLYVGCEDDMHELHRRFQAQGEAPRSSAGDIRLVSLIGHDTALHPPFRFGVIPEDAPDTPFYLFLEHHLAAMGAGDKMLFLDNLGQMFFGDDTSKPQIATFMNRYCRRLLMKHNTTGCILAHPSESQVQSGQGGAGSPAWSANVRSHLYFDWVRDGKNGESGRPLDDTRVFSRKKANYSKVHRPGDGVFLTRGDDWTFRIAARPPTPETPRAKAKRERDVEESNKMFVVRAALLKMMEAHVGRKWASDAVLSKDLAAAMDNVMTADNLRTQYLRKIKIAGFPHHHDEQGWICISKTGEGE